jgi:hypothetical protein
MEIRISVLLSEGINEINTGYTGNLKTSKKLAYLDDNKRTIYYHVVSIKKRKQICDKPKS